MSLHHGDIMVTLTGRVKNQKVLHFYFDWFEQQQRVCSQASCSEILDTARGRIIRQPSRVRTALRHARSVPFLFVHALN
ncbi:MAG: hypothetical protein JNM44_06995 [Chitinophagaceae bacterium]|nr:hypothetical protein [Chitinophagaceae bacterium]